jgi:hypothetical protein
VKSILGFLANLLLFLSISTLLFSVAAYFAFKIKAKRKPRARPSQLQHVGSVVEPELLQQYVQPEPKAVISKSKTSKLTDRSKPPRA